LLSYREKHVSAPTYRAFPSRAAWRAWLVKNHAKADEVWVVYYKKASGKQSVDYAASVEEALCFGWIDGLKKRIDDDRYTHRFTPRKLGSRWSPLNIERAEELIAVGKMMPWGAAAFERRRGYDERILAARAGVEIPLTPEIEKALRASRSAWQNFTALAPSHRNQYVGWLRSAKRPETLMKRLAEAVQLLEKNAKLGMK
jgi:uncharacterized protein YdeI (YjbR/CyaY-like superfamily)